jgi:hypothetical protein
MLKAVQGFYRNGKIELSETPQDIKEAKVVVTFLPADSAVDLREYGITAAEAAEMRRRLGVIAEDWDSPEMDIYNDT